MSNFHPLKVVGRVNETPSSGYRFRLDTSAGVFDILVTIFLIQSHVLYRCTMLVYSHIKKQIQICPIADTWKKICDKFFHFNKCNFK